MAAENQNPTLVAAVETAEGTDQTPGGEKTGADRRAHPRLRPHELRDLQARLASGADIRLIDLSRGGAQFETDRRFLPNSSIALRLVTPDSTFVVNGRVVRSRIVRLEQGGLGYNVAVAFSQALEQQIEGDTPPPVALATPTESPATGLSQESRDDFPATTRGTGLPVELVSAADAALGAAPAAPSAPTARLSAFEEVASDVTPEEQAAFEATVIDAPMVLTVTASVDRSSEELRDLFNGNDW